MNKQKSAHRSARTWRRGTNYRTCLLALLALTWCACGGPRRVEQPKRKAPPQDKPAEKLKISVTGGELVLSDQQGQRVLEGEAKQMTYDAERKLGIFQQGRCSFLEKGQVVTVAQAPLIILDYTRDLVTMTGGVLARSEVHYSMFRAERAVWDTKHKQVHASGKVEFRRDQRGFYSVTGPSLTGDTELRRVQMPNVRIRAVEVPTAKPTAARRR